ncbi:MAG: hypothetical protein AB2A00_40595 [Myxococcota bacterium]
MPDAGTPPPCGRTEMFADDFEDDVVDLARWRNTFVDELVTLEEVDGHTRITLPVNVGGSQYGALISTAAYDLRESSLTVEVADLDAGDLAQVYFKAGFSSEEELEFIVEFGMLRFRQRMGGQWLLRGELPHDATAHRFWRFREDQGVVRWETSPDGVAFTTHESLVDWPYAASVYVVLGAGLYTPETAERFVEFEGVNGGTPVGEACPLASFVETFSDDTDLRWRTFGEPGICDVVLANGVLEARPSSVEGYCGMGTRSVYRLDANGVLVHVLQMVNTDTSTNAFFNVGDVYENRAEFIHESGNLYAKRFVLDSPSLVAVEPYDPPAHAWWRLRREGGLVSWETSADGVNWTPFHAEPDFLGPDVMVYLGVGTYEPVADPGYAIFDNINGPAP